MLHNLWKCFETTGDISHYLSFKEYEKTYNGKSEEDGELEGLIDRNE